MTNIRCERVAEDSAANRHSARTMVSGNGWSIAEFTCRQGPGDRAFEERHDSVSVAAVIEGTFNYTSATGHACMHPGALLLGNFGACYECGHDHSTGDRCISVRFAPEYFAEIAATFAGSSKFRFPIAMLPSDRSILRHTVLLEAVAGGHANALHIEENMIRFMASIASALSGTAQPTFHISPRDERRVSRALRSIEARASEALTLDDLAATAAMSKFHFLRVFRRVTGVTPYRFLLTVRLRRAAMRLLQSSDPITAIAFDTGFGDISTFNAAFRVQFGETPSTFQKGQARGHAIAKPGVSWSISH